MPTNTGEIDELVRKPENLRGVLFGSGWGREESIRATYGPFLFLYGWPIIRSASSHPSQTWIRLLIPEGADR